MHLLLTSNTFAVNSQIWDVRTKASVHTLSGHTNAVATVKCQAAEPQIITGMVGMVS